MTDKEKAIVMAYTGVCMLNGDKFQIFHKYVEDIMGRPVYTHELADTAVKDEITEKAKADFITLCAEQEPKDGYWIPCSDGLPKIHNDVQEYIVTIEGNFIRTAFFTETNGRSWWSINNVTAWMPFPEPYKPESCGVE